MMKYIYNFNFKKKNSFFEKKIICFVDVETGPRLRYIITGQKGDTRMGNILPTMYS
jgi:hypothetical protein